MRWSCWSFSWVNSAHGSRCVCVCSLLCVCTWMGQMQRTHFTAGYTLYNCVCDKKNKIIYIYIYRLSFFFQNRYPIMVKCLNIGNNIGKPIYRSISNFDQCKIKLWWTKETFKNIKYCKYLTNLKRLNSSKISTLVIDYRYKVRVNKQNKAKLLNDTISLQVPTYVGKSQHWVDPTTHPRTNIHIHHSESSTHVKSTTLNYHWTTSLT